MSAGAWVPDLRLGIGLAFSGRRSGWSRLLLAALGTAVGVCLLLLAASLPHALDARQAREDARIVDASGPRAGVDPVEITDGSTQFHGRSIDISYVEQTGPHPPLPPGVAPLPKAGEVVLSPALSRLLSSSDGQLLRPRFAGRRIGTIAAAGLSGPADLRAYVGTTGSKGSAGAQRTYRFGGSVHRAALPAPLAALLVIGVAALLFPVFVFVMTTARLSGGDRDRRLAALRLLGADTRQTRRIAASEMLLGSFGGLLLGGALFFAVRPLAAGVTISGESVFTGDVVPSGISVVLIALAIPSVTTGAALLAQRRTIVEPLGVVRQGGQGHRHVWWRLLPGILGGLLLLQRSAGTVSTTRLVVGVIGLLATVPLVLPWLVEFGLRHLRPTSPAAQLGTGRLRLDSGTPARVVAGVAVALTGAVAVFSLLKVVGDTYVTGGSADDPGVLVSAGAPVSLPALQRVPGVSAVVPGYPVFFAGDASGLVISCPTIRALSPDTACRDGQVFAPRHGRSRALVPGHDLSTDVAGHNPQWTIPRLLPVRLPTWLPADLLITPGAAYRSWLDPMQHQTYVRYDPRRGDTVERLRNALAPLQWRVYTYVQSGPDDAAATGDASTYQHIRAGLYAGALLTLAMAAATMLVLVVEQVRERRRPLAALAASGVPRSTLVRSVLWQNAIPLAFGVVVADGIGVLLAVLLLRLINEPIGVDWAGLGWLTGAAVVAVAVATALSLPAIRQATRPTMLRAE